MLNLRHRKWCQKPIEQQYIGTYGDTMLGCSNCRVHRPITAIADLAQSEEPRDDLEPDPAPSDARRFVLDCIDCDHTIRLFSPRPRIPLCHNCKTRRTHKKAESE